MHLIVYSSKIAVDESSTLQVLEEIIDSARKYNSENGLTGVLLFQNGYFLQALEGEEGPLRNLYAKISADVRHTGMTCHVDQAIKSRTFANWSMDLFKIDNEEIFDSQTIGTIQSLYDHSFEMNSKALIEFIKKIIDEVDTFKIKGCGVTQ